MKHAFRKSSRKQLALQSFCGRAVLQQVVTDVGEFLAALFAPSTSWTTVLHGEQLGAQVVEPQDVRVRLVVIPLVTGGRG